jgi:hypothetical protein
MRDGMLSGKIAHSCKHGPPPHKVKVCITKKYNEKVWPPVLSKVGPKPEPRRMRRRRSCQVRPDSWLIGRPEEHIRRMA